MKPKVGIFGLTGCGGCQLQIINLGAKLVEIANHVEVVNFVMAQSKPRNDYQIAVVEGAVTTKDEAKALQDIRKRAKVLIAIGACATHGGVPSLKNQFNLQTIKKTVYGRQASYIETIPTKALDELVKVDFYLYGCPPIGEEFVGIVKALLLGQAPRMIDYPVCVECRQKETVCVFDRIPVIKQQDEKVCLGPVSRAGCGAPCPSGGSFCTGCRGLISDANLASEETILKEHCLTVKDILSWYRLFGLAGSQKKAV